MVNHSIAAECPNIYMYMEDVSLFKFPKSLFYDGNGLSKYREQKLGTMNIACFVVTTSMLAVLS